MSAKLIYVTDEEFDLLSHTLQMGGLAFDKINLENKIIFMRDRFNETSTKHIMTRTEAVTLLKKHTPMVEDACKIINFYVEAGMLEVKEDAEDKPIFEIKGKYGSPLHIKIWANGKIEGIEGVVINRIQQYLENNS